MTLLNNSVELSSNLDKPVPLKEWNKNSSAHPIFELVSGSIGWGAGLQSSRLVQGKSSNPLKVLIKETKVIYQSINQLNSGWCHTVIKFHLHYLTVTLLNNSVELSSNLDKPVPLKEWNKNSSAHPIFELVSGSIGWGAGLQSSRLVQGKSSNPLKVLIKETKVIYQSINQLNSGWCHTVIKFHLHYLTVTLLNNSVELSSNLDKPVPLKEWNKNSSAHPIFELVSGSIGWGAGLQSSRLVQGKSSNPLKVLIKETKVIYQSINQLNSGWCHTVIKFHLHYLTVTLLNNSVELSSNLDKPVPLKEWNKNSSAHPIFELVSGSIGWGAGLQSSRLVQGKSSNPLKVLIKETKVIYQSINQLNSGWCHTVIKFHLHYLTVTLLNNSVELSSNLDKPVPLKEWNKNSSAHPIFELVSGSIGWGAGLQSSRLVQGKSSNPLKVLIKETKVIYQSINQLNSGWCHTVIKFHLHYLTVTLLNNSVELSSNLDKPVPLKEWNKNSSAHPIFELVSGSIGWGAGLQSSRLVQGKSSNPLKVLIKETKVIYQSINQLNSGWCHTVIKFHLHYLTVTLLNNSVELSSNLDKPVPLKEWNKNSSAHPIFELVSGSIGWGAGLQSSRLVQGKSSNPLKVLIKETKVIYQSINQLNSGWCHTVIKFHLHYLTVTLLNNSVELSSNLDKPVPLKEWNKNSSAHPIFELVSGSIGWGAGLQSSRLVQGKSSNPLKVLIKETKVIYQSINQLNSGWCNTVIKFHLHYLTE